jgi:hypothetical protein
MVAFVTSSTDAILAAQTAAIAAKSLGIDSLFTNGIHRADLHDVYERLGLPEQHCFPLILLILGYPTREPEFLKGRITGEGVIHYGKYHHLTAKELDKMVAAYDDPANHLVLNDAWQAGNYAHYFDWFFTAWCRPGYNPKDAQFIEFLSHGGFLQLKP